MVQVKIEGQIVTVGRSIGKGGEGEVFALEGRAKEALKIYKPDLRAARESKVRAMVTGDLAKCTDLVAFPASIATSTDRKFIGFVMRLVSGYRPLHQIYSPKSRQIHFPEADYRAVVRTALNVANAVGKVHQSGCVIGDLNHSGILVAKNATVSLIDADSFQFQQGGKDYPCLVGVPEFTPPELQGQNLSGVRRTVAHDNFGLAVGIFHLLFMGRHPYAGVYRAADLNMGEAIAQNRFAFSTRRRAQTQTTPPPGSPTLEMFPKNVQDAFEKAFGLSPEQRPSPADWVVVLQEFERTLVRCGDSSSHYYPRAIGSCLWCGLASVSGFDMFPPDYSTAADRTVNSAGMDHIIRQLEAYSLTPLETLVASPSKKQRNSAAFQKAKIDIATRRFVGAGMIAGAVATFIFASDLWFFAVLGGVAGFFTVQAASLDQATWRAEVKKTQAALQTELTGFLQRTGTSSVYAAAEGVQPLIKAYRAVDQQRAEALQTLNATRKDRQLTAHLDKFHIRDASIHGIGPSKTAKLASFGIETAADVSRSSVEAVPGFGPVKSRALVEWRRKHEARFRFVGTPTSQDKRDEVQLRGRFEAYRSKLESSLRETLSILRQGEVRVQGLQTRAKSDKRFQAAYSSYHMALADWSGSGGNVSVFIPAGPSAKPIGAIPPRVLSPKATQLPKQPNFGGFGRSTSRNSGGSSTRTKTGSTPKCPNCYKSMFRRSGRYGAFWGCSQYPKCRGTRNIS